MILRQLDILIYPPAINILLLIAALLLWHKRKTSITLIVISTFTLIIFSLPVTSHRLTLMLEKYPAITPAQLEKFQADAIVLLGGGMISYASEYEGSSPADETLMRLRYAAFVQRQTGLPLLTSGGVTGKAGSDSEAETMRRILADDYGIHNVHTESSSMTTYENAVQSVAILKQNSMQKIFLVTSSLHMNRAVDLFTGLGMEVIPAPTNLISDYDTNWQYFIPSGNGLKGSRYALHEYLGIAWYRLRGMLDR
ncbi:MAG: YdcF family protein [Gammaproteobacteria bacterium]|nr:YdcF family protein [Gammaproteobacteria bacterium]